MFIEHIDLLRCTMPHRESWLVASLSKREDRFVIDATLGCHVCLRQYPIIQGVAYFGTVPDDRPSHVPESGDTEAAIRIAAWLGLAERSTVVLAGEWGIYAHAVAALFPLTVFALNPSAAVSDSSHVSVVSSSEGIPLASSSAHGVALDGTTATVNNMTTALNVLRPGGRLVAPAGTAPPAGISILASDDNYWVGEKAATPVSLRRA